LIVVNCIILGRAEAFASKNGVGASAVDGLGMGIGFTLALMTLGCLREILGSGSLFGVMLVGPTTPTILIFVLPPGAFITLGLLLWLMNEFDARRARHV
jgi:electron transport complex protein RnfE